MKIVISSEGENRESILDRRFGRCSFFVVYDTESKEIKVIANDGLSASGGAGIAAANQILEEDAEVVITGNLGPNAYGLLEKAGVKTYNCEAISIDQVIEKYENNQLSQIAVAGRAHNGMQ